MDKIQKAFYRLKFELAFARSNFDAFEDFFADLMGHRHPGDFRKVRPYGKSGDLKCDGYLASEKTVFQCYGPREMRLAPLLSKIDADFNGAVEHWGEKMRRWVFVHNDAEGLPAQAVQAIEALERSHPDLVVEVWSEIELHKVVMQLGQDDLEDMFGYAPSLSAIDHLDFEELLPVIKALSKSEPIPLSSIKAPSAAKLLHNGLSEDVQALLRQGRTREPLVESFFEEWPDPEYGEQVAQAFRERYSRLKSQDLAPDEIFAELQSFAGGMGGSVARQGAILAVLAYFFERCDIFEDPLVLP